MKKLALLFLFFGLSLAAQNQNNLNGGSSGPGAATYVVKDSSGSPPTNYQVLTAGSNITLTPGSNTLTIAASGGGGSVAGADTDVQINKTAAFGVDTGVFRYDYSNHQLFVGSGGTAYTGNFKGTRAVSDGAHHRWFEEASTWTATADNFGSGVFADFVTYAGTHNYDHEATVEGSPSFNTSGTLGAQYGAKLGLTVNGTTITQRTGVTIDNPVVNTGSIATNIAIQIANQTGGSSNYAIDDRCTGCVSWHAGKFAFGAFAAPTHTIDVAAGDIAFAGGKGQHLDTQAAGNDIAGTVATSSSTTASVTFTTNYGATPACALTPRTAGITSWYLSATSVSGFTVTVAPSGTYTFAYICFGNPN